MGKKKKKTKKKERQVWAYGTTPITNSIELVYDSLTDSVSFFPHEEGSLKTVSSYEREPGKKEKSLVSVPCIGASSLNVNQDLKNNYSYIFGVDTNSTTYRGHKISATAIYVVPNELCTYNEQVPFIPYYGFIILDPNESINPERIGWHLAIHGQKFRTGSKGVAMAVDSELGSHQDINGKKIPYYEDFFLPEMLTLVYGSSDHRKESIVNGLLYMCDRAAKDILKHVMSGEFDLNVIAENNDPNYYGAVEFKLNDSHDIIHL